MSATKDGGPAFPGPDQQEQHINIHEGMSLRDYFAAQAMAVVPERASHNMLPNESNAAYVARRAYEYADAMLKAREVK